MKGRSTETVADLDNETDEHLVVQNLSEIFEVGRYGQKFRKTEIKDLEGQLIRLMDLFWQNRRRRDGLEIFNEKYYQDFFKAREALINQVVKLDEEISAAPEGLEQSKIVLAELKKELNDFDQKNENSEPDRLDFKDVETRQRKEWQLTEVAAALMKDLEPDEFAVIMLEQLERTFNQEKAIVADRKVLDNEGKRAKLILDIVSGAVNKWRKARENERG